eukprot:361855-Chlamydomonas_euryale.AAC.3
MSDEGAPEYKIWLGGLNWNMTDEDLRQEVTAALGSRARITSVKVLFDHATRRSKGFAFVGCVDSEARLAFTRVLVHDAVVLQRSLQRLQDLTRARTLRSHGQMDRREMMGRVVTVAPAAGNSGTHGGSGPDRGREDDRRGPGSKRGFRVELTGLPEAYTWRDLKDLLRIGDLAITYANVSRPGIGYSSWGMRLPPSTRFQHGSCNHEWGPDVSGTMAVLNQIWEDSGPTTVDMWPHAVGQSCAVGMSWPWLWASCMLVASACKGLLAHGACVHYSCWQNMSYLVRDAAGCCRKPLLYAAGLRMSDKLPAPLAISTPWKAASACHLDVTALHGRDQPGQRHK